MMKTPGTLWSSSLKSSLSESKSVASIVTTKSFISASSLTNVYMVLFRISGGLESS